jgi:4-amino-4-deoxy-L-arabinose transferase-like glycosyltransferase
MAKRESMTTAKTPPILQRDNLVSLVRLLGALALSGLATSSLRSKQPVDGILFLAGAAALFLVEFYRRPGLVGTTPVLPLQGPGDTCAKDARLDEPPLSGRPWLVLGPALLAAVAAWFLFADNHLSLPGLALVVAAIVAIVVATRQRTGAPPAGQSAANDLLSPRVRYLALAGIVLLAVIFRLYLLDSLPGDMFNDLAHNYEATQRILNGQWMIYATDYPGREPLLFYLTALLSYLTGLNFFTLKLVTALIGIVTVPVVYLLGREAFNDAVGLVAALLLAVAKWHVLISRVGFRGIQTPLYAALVLYFLLRGLRRGRRADFLWAGGFAGLALYTYTAALAIWPAVVLGLGLYALAGHARDLWRVRRSLLLATLIAVLVALPMLRYMLVDGRDLFWSRPLTRVSERETQIPGSWGAILWENVVHTAGMFHVQGDSIFRTNVPYDPHLDVAAGMFFLLGLPVVLVGWRRGGNALVLVFFLLLLLPTTLSLAFPQEVPGAVRSGGAMATVMLFPAVALVAAFRRLGQILPALNSRWAWGGLLAGLALWSGLFNAQLCFVTYPKVLPEENYPLFRRIAQAIDEFGADGPVLLKTIPYWDDKDAIRVQTRGHKEWGLNGEIIDRIDSQMLRSLNAPQAAVIVNPEQDAASLASLEQLYPHGVTVYYRDPRGKAQFAVFLFKTGGSP